MNISGWLDEKEGEGVDVSQIVLPNDLAYDEGPEETIFFRRFVLAESSAQRITPFLLSNALETGITAEVRTRRPAFTHREWNGSYLPEIKILLSKRLNHT